MPTVSPSLAVWVSYTASPDEQPYATQAQGVTNIDTLLGSAGLELEASLACLSSGTSQDTLSKEEKRVLFTNGFAQPAGLGLDQV